MTTWRPIPDLPGYEASDTGHIRSLLRGSPYVMRATPGPCGYATLMVRRSGRGNVCRVPTLVALAWLGPRPRGARIRHLDGDPFNDEPDNLAYGTSRDVARDEAARARREEAAGAPTHCAVGHRLADTYLGDYGRRLCRTCRYQERAAVRDTEARHADCQDCGVALPPKTGPGPLLKRCSPCRREAGRQATRRYEARRREAGLTLRPSREPDAA